MAWKRGVVWKGGGRGGGPARTRAPLPPLKQYLKLLISKGRGPNPAPGSLHSPCSHASLCRAPLCLPGRRVEDLQRSGTFRHVCLLMTEKDYARQTDLFSAVFRWAFQGGTGAVQRRYRGTGQCVALPLRLLLLGPRPAMAWLGPGWRLPAHWLTWHASPLLGCRSLPALVPPPVLTHLPVLPPLQPSVGQPKQQQRRGGLLRMGRIRAAGGRVGRAAGDC